MKQESALVKLNWWLLVFWLVVTFANEARGEELSIEERSINIGYNMGELIYLELLDEYKNDNIGWRPTLDDFNEDFPEVTKRVFEKYKNFFFSDGDEDRYDWALIYKNMNKSFNMRASYDFYKK